MSKNLLKQSKIHLRAGGSEYRFKLPQVTDISEEEIQMELELLDEAHGYLQTRTSYFTFIEKKEEYTRGILRYAGRRVPDGYWRQNFLISSGLIPRSSAAGSFIVKNEISNVDRRISGIMLE